MRKSLALLLVLLTLCLGACAAPSFKRHPVPEALVNDAVVAGFPKWVRSWGDEDFPLEDYPALVEMYREHDLDAQVINWLALSGGGQNGAFGAGLLVGWTERGDRPVFQAVTGVSTGALIAPFAFLGPDYDDLLEETYTTYSTKDLIRKRGLVTALMSDAAASTKGLERLLERYITEEVVDAIAYEWRENARSLLVSTTNMDTMRPVRWNLTRIADSDNPRRVELIRQVLLASASIPVAFPPVFIEVEAGGKPYDEMHMDGGATSQLFAYSLQVDMRQFLMDIGVAQSPRLYVIRNGRIRPAWKAVKPKLPAIGGRAIESLIRTQGIGDVLQVYVASLRDDLDFHLASIPESFDMAPDEEFDPEYMRALFELGREMARNGYPWETTPPNIDPETIRQRH